MLFSMDRRTFVVTSLGVLSAPLAGSAAASPEELPFRQVHLDFHTSELIPEVGADFNREDFVRTLKDARVNSVNVFAKCHHGYAYYDTAIAAKHPSLKIDLLGEMVKGCRPAGIRLNYYYSLVWDVLQSRRHPEWLQIDRDGKRIGGPPSDAWPWLCMNSPYLDHVVAENREILARYETDGAWFDILKQPPDGCYCRWCVEDRTKLGLSDSPADIFRHNKLVARRTEQRLFDLTRARFPNALTFFNSRLVIGVRDELPFYSHIEIESLPTGGWGYAHFQQRVRYMRTLGKDMVGMTGRFHKSWGDFGGLKNQAALDFECLNFLANGTKVCVGDQLHPRGRLDPVTYARIGASYRRIEALEPWARGAKPAVDIGVVSSAATNPERTTQKIPTTDQGFTNMLLELHQQFDVLDTGSDLTPYKIVIVPDDVRPVPELVEKLKRFAAAGGALIVSHESLLDRETKQFALEMGVRYQGPAKYQGEYMLIPGHDTAYYLYQRGTSVTADGGAEILATYGHPYFDRSPDHFSSHKQTPMGQRTNEPLIARRGRIVYIANPFFASYALDGYGIQKQMIGELLNTLLPKPLVLAPNLPSTAQVTVLEQPGRHIVHLLYYPLTRRAPDIDIIEEPGLLENVELKLRVPKRPARVMLVPEKRPVPFTYADGYASCQVSKVRGHQALAFEA